jgi:hypothetical protein
VVTTEEIGAVELFAALDEAQREQLARVAADITLVAGEYAAPEGGERALFGVLDGLIEPVKLVDGIERVLGKRRATSLGRFRWSSARSSRSASAPRRHRASCGSRRPTITPSRPSYRT